MKLFKQLLVAPAALGLLAPVAVSAAELNVSGVNQYAASSQEQVTSISQFSDVRPTDWAYQALSNLIERYGCVAGYPNGTFKGGQAMTRYEAAALLNACLDRISEVTDELKKLMAEFEKELAVLRGRVDGLEAKVGELEANQFSTTTKLKGIATFVLGANSYSGSSNFFQRLSAAPAGRPGPQFSVPANYVPGTNDVSYLKGIQGATTFNYDVRLNFDTSFTGKDLLRTTLRAGNAANTAYANGILPNNGLEAFFQDTTIPGSNANNIVGINRLFYQFPIGKSWTATVGGRVRQDDMLAMWPSAYPADTILDFFTYAGSPAAYSLNLGAGAGLWYRNNGFSLSANYVAQNGQNGSPSIDNCGGRIGCGGIGTDASAQTFTAQAGYAANNWGAAVAYTYGNGTTIPAGTPLASFGGDGGAIAVGVGDGCTPVVGCIASLGGEGLGRGIGADATTADAAAAIVNTRAAVLAVLSNIVCAQAEAIVPVPETSTGTEVQAVGRRRTGVGEEVKDRIRRIGARPHGQHVVLTNTAAHSGRPALADRELIEEAVDADDVVGVAAGDGRILEERLQTVIGEDSVGVRGVCGVTSAQGGAQQILTCEAGVEVQTNVVVEGGCTLNALQVGNIIGAGHIVRRN